MRLALKISRETLSQPLPATCFLETQKSVAFHHAERGLRHPTAIYAHSLASVVDAFNRVFEGLDALGRVEASKQIGSEAAALLSRDTHSLIHAVFEHFEHCKSIVLVFVHGLSAKEQDKRARGFTATVHDAKAFAAVQANTIKHSQATVRLLQMTGADRIVTGYYIEGVDREGAVSPHPTVHPGGRTAFSFGRALRYFACSVRFASGALVSSLDATYPLEESAVGLGPLAPIVERLAGFDHYVFPDEGGAVVPSIVARASTLAIDFPSRNRWLCMDNCKIVTTHALDGVMWSFGLPYWVNSSQ